MIFSEELNEIFSYYFINNEENFDFLNSINAKNIIKHSHKKNTLLINSSIDLELSSIMNEYKKIIFNSQLRNSLQNEKIIKVISDINHWTFNLHSFDNIINTALSDWKSHIRINCNSRLILFDQHCKFISHNIICYCDWAISNRY